MDVTPETTFETLASMTETLADRLELVMQWKGWSAREWARQAGLEEESHVNALLTRHRKNPQAGGDIRTFAKLADAAKVSLDWLWSGRGSPEGRDSLASDPLYPARAVAIGAARLARWHEAAIAEISAEVGFKSDPGLGYWIQALQLAHAKLAALGDIPGHPALPPKPRSKRRRGRK